MKTIFTKLLFTLFLALVSYITFSQSCGFDIIHQRRMQTDPLYRSMVADQENSLQRIITAQKEIVHSPLAPHAPLYTIPVVVHVIHTGEAIGTTYNPTSIQIEAAIEYLNQVFDGTYPGTSGAGDIEIQFVLAQRDPNCNPTDGINRIDGSGVAGYITNGVNVGSSGGANELTIKNLIRWNTSNYYNIWIVNKIDGNDGTSGSFTAGFAYFPGSSPLYDGTMMLATQMTPGAKTLPHEIGHAFNLYHPFEGASGATCPTNTDCANQGDRVCDTDPVTQPSSTCRTGINPCTGAAYNDYTESNYMNYTSCATLFTDGQKTRMLAAATLPSRISLANSLGGTPPNSGSSTCIPKINFEFTESSEVEVNTITSGCRSYSDYTYYMTIGNNPTAAATATINIASGSATEGVDFDITTNGNFSSPSKVLTFPGGTNASQAFTIRVYDDVIIDGPESVTLGFTVNDGGGNAVAGEARPNLTIDISDNDAAPMSPGTPINYSIGSYNGNAAVQSAFRSNEQKHRLQVLYSAAELSAAGATAGSISALTLRVATKNSTKAFNGFTISMANTATTNLNTGFVATTFTQVYTGNYTSATGNNTFTFGTGAGSSSTFTWDGVSNIVVQFCFDNNPLAADASSDVMEANSGPLGANYATIYSNHSAEATAGCALNPATISQARINATFTFGSAGNPPASVLNTSKTEYLGPNADVYFYGGSGEILARIRNLTSHDYGCTQVVIDRAGTGASQFWNNNTANYLMNKTVRVLPANNNASGQYEITLYYSQDEVNGWQTATGQSFNNIQFVKAAGQILSVTPASPNAAGVVSTVIPTRGTYGSHYTLAYSFNSGFSGFGAGIPAGALPVQILEFGGRLRNGNVELAWKTSLENNSRSFEIERSDDGIHFSKIGTVAAAGNSNTTKAYGFTDNIIAQENNYYRLKQVDVDNSFEYSKVILITNPLRSSRPFTVVNPLSDNLDLQFSSIPNSKVSIRLSDLKGRQILNWNNRVLNQRVRISLSNYQLISGIYILHAKIDGKDYTQKIFKK